jgi:iron(III) transport system substrate-binding protein
MGSTQTITGIAFSHNDPNRMWVTRSGYQSGQKVWETGNGGISWANISGTLPNIPANYTQMLVKNDFAWAAKNRERILAEWTKRYNGKAAPR